MKKITSLLLIIILSACSSASRFGTGVNITFDPRTIGMQIDDTIMQKNLSARLALTDKKYFISIQSEVLDGRIFLSGKVEEPEEKIKITKMAWETKGVRSVKNAITIRGQGNFKSTAKDILIMPALHSAAISTKLMKVFGGGKLIGPLLIGLGLPIEVAPLRASTSEILNLASIASYSSGVIDYTN